MEDETPLLDNPENIVRLAERNKQPSPPTEGIKKQWLTPLIRWPVRFLFLPFVLFDLAIQRFVRLFFKTPYKQKGKCNQRGNCCYYILIPFPDTFLTKLSYFWNTQINGFYPRKKTPLIVDDQKLMVMGCRYLQKNGTCKHYLTRPTVCRQWPYIEYFGVPKILKGCGFYAEPRDKNFNPYPNETNTPKNKLNIVK